MSETVLAPVRAVWSAFQRRDWSQARELLADELVATWWTSGERFRGADGFLSAQSNYPEGWTLHVLEISPLVDGRVLSLVRVDHPPHGVFFCTSISRVVAGRLVEVEEYWGTLEPPPAWRDALAGRERFDPTQDARCTGEVGP